MIAAKRPIINHATKNIIPFSKSPAIAWPKPGMKKDNIAQIIAFNIFFPSDIVRILKFFKVIISKLVYKLLKKSEIIKKLMKKKWKNSQIMNKLSKT